MNEKFNSSIIKRLLSLCLAVLFLLSSFVEAFAGTSLENALNKVHLYVKEGKGQQLLTWKGVIDADNFVPAIIVYRSEDGNEYPAYCANPNRPGVEDLIAKSYDVDVDKLDTDPHVWGVITNGYPYKSPQELGLSTEYQAYYATKMAVWATVHANYSNLNDWKANGSHNQPVEAAMKNLVAKGKANDVVYATWLAVNPKSQKAEVDSIDSNYYSQEFEIKSNVKIDSFKIVFDGNVPEGVKATNLQNEEQETFSGDTNTIKVLIPKKDGGEQKGTFNVIAKGKLENKAVMFGISHSGKKQDYYVAPIPFYNGDSIGKVTYYADGTTPPPDEPKEPDTPDQPNTPDTPDIPEPGKGLQILKVKAGTTQGLSGAVIRLTDADGGIIGDYVTNEQGEISIPDLAVGAYYVEEIVAPEGYLLDENNHKDFVINTIDPVIITFANEEMAELEVKKVDADTGEPLSGASIRVAYDGGSDCYDVYTNDAGTATLSNLKSGTYTVTEITAPEGYLLDSTSQSIKLEAGKKATITIKNKAKPGLLIKKYDEDTGMPLQNAEFSVKKKDGSIVYEGMTDKSGQIKIENLEPDWYTITEIAPPKGYLIATESKDVKLEPNKVTEIKFDNRLRPALQIMKIDSQTGEPLKGAVFKVVKTEDSTESEYTTDNTGTILIQDLDEAIYTVTEVKSPDGYLLDEQHKDIELEWGKTKQVVFTNKKRPALEILKIDEATKKPLAGAKFKVTSTEGNTTSEYVTDNSGKILIENLNAEIYTIEEIVAPDGYLLEEQHKDIELEWGKTKQVVFTNKKRPVLTIQKIDSKTKEPLAGAKFKVTKTEDKTVSEYTTDKTGTIIIENLDESIYTVEEITAPEGYILEPQHKEIALEWGKNKTLVYEDTRKPTLIITKTNALTYKPIPNTTYKIEYEGQNGGITTLGTYRTDKNGQIILPKVQPGWYIITEIRPAQGFSKPSNVVTRKYLAPGENAYTVIDKEESNNVIENAENTGTVADKVENIFTSIIENNKNNQTLNSNTEIKVTSGSAYNLGEEIVNYPLNSIVIKKVDANTSELLDGAAFEVRKVTEDISGNSGTIIGRYTTDNSGVIVITGLEAGGYIIEEVKPPTNYLLSENSQQQAWLKADGTSIVEVTFSNYPYGSILVSKTDALTGKSLANARFKVTTGAGTAAGSSNGEFITNENGEFLVPNLKPGSYVVTELEAPQNYVLDTTPQTVDIGTDGKVYKLSFKNQPVSTLVILKMDSNSKKPLANAEFKVTTSKGDVVGKGNGIFKTDETGTITIPNLQKGSYIVEEIKSPEGYLLENQSKTISIDYGKTYTLEFFNKPLASVIIKKFDSENKEPLTGAIFKISKKSGNVIGEYTTDKNGMIQIDELQPGWYTAVEVKAPDGYLLNDTIKDFEIKTGKTVTVEFPNQKLTSLIIKKTDEKSGQPLSGAKFYVEKQNGEHVGEYTTDKDGTINIATLSPDWYVIREKLSPEGYLLDETPKTVEVKTNVPTVVTFTNKKLTALEIKKIDEKSGEPLSGAKFIVERQNGEKMGEYTTDKAGSISIPELSPDWYVVKEIKSPNGYLLDETPKTVEIKTNTPTVVTFTNKKLTALEIKKIDESSAAPLSGAKFVVTKQNGEQIGEYTTDKTGSISIPELSPDWYVVKEIKSPNGYLLDETPKTVEIRTNTPTVVTFTNKKLTALQIKKVDEESGEPLSGAKFKVTKQSGDVIGEYTTDKDGFINVPTLQPGYYAVSEMKAPDGYLLDETPKTVEIKTNTPTVVTFTNKKLTALQIKKVDEKSREPLSGAKFVIEKQNGEQIGEYTTDKACSISIPELLPDWYVIKEVKAPDGYLLDETPKTVEVKTNTPTVVTFVNKPLAALQIKKVDAQTNVPLAGAVFKVTKHNGELVGEYKTATDGFINVPTLQPGHYTISEMKAPDGYILDETPKTVEIKTNTPTLVTFTNKALSGLKIIKLDSVTREPLKGVEFTIAKMNGEKVGSYKTDATGMIAVTNLEDGYYTVTETKGLEGYLSDKEPKTVEIKSGKPTILEVMNEPYPSLVIYKKAGNTGKPLEGVSFLITKFNGEQIGTYKTDKSGMIVIEGLEEGKYLVKETETVKGYELDTEAKEVDIKYGKRTTLEVVNNPLSSVIIRKIDSVTKEGIYGVTFLLYDEHDNPLGQFVSDNEGYVWLDKELEEGKYKLRELQPADGYLPDDVPRTIYVKAGQTTEITWENTPQKGQIVITKRSADYNALTGLPAGSPLAGASFEVYNMTGNLMDKMVSAENGVAASKPLPTGVYMIKEVSAPRYYAVNTKELYAEIRHNGDIVKFEFLDSSIDLNLTIDKKGANQISPGQTIAYELYNIKNQSSAVLENFYIHDRIPTDAARVTKIVTGTYSERLYYNITYKTNYKDYRTLAENLLSKNSYEYSLHPNALGLAAGEYVTDVRLEFTKASPGFQSLENMTVFCEVMPTIPKDYKVVNRADCGGRYGNEWESANTSWTTIVWKQDTPKTPLPKTGW